MKLLDGITIDPLAIEREVGATYDVLMEVATCATPTEDSSKK
jgi:hypothetical protein